MSFSYLANLAACSGWRSWNKSPVKQKTHQEVGNRSMFALGPHRFTTLLELAGWCWRIQTLDEHFYLSTVIKTINLK